MIENEAGAQMPGEPGRPDAASGMMTSRRRLLRGGLAAAPVMMTLVSRPVIAGSTAGVCTAASAVGSINTSGKSNKTFSCTGKTPNSWKTTSVWPASCGQATLFDTAFGGRSFPGKSFLDVLQLSDTSGQGGLARYLVAAYLNNASKVVPDVVLSQSTAKTIWTAVVTNQIGWYEPTAGVKWYPDYSVPSTNQPAGLIDWIKTTMPG